MIRLAQMRFEEWIKLDPDLWRETSMMPISYALAIWHERHPKELPLEDIRSVSREAVDIAERRAAGERW